MCTDIDYIGLVDIFSYSYRVYKESICIFTPLSCDGEMISDG